MCLLLEERCNILFKLNICGCGRKQIPAKTELSVFPIVHTDRGLQWQLHPWCHKLAGGCPNCTTVTTACGSDIALNKPHGIHHWLHFSPCATDPKNRALKQFERLWWYTFPASLSFTFPALRLFSHPSFLHFRVWWEKSTAASECRGRWNRRSLRWSWMQLWRRGWTHTFWKSGTAGMKTLCHPHTTSNPKPKCLRTTRTRWVQLTRYHCRGRKGICWWLLVFLMGYFTHTDVINRGFSSADNGFFSLSSVVHEFHSPWGTYFICTYRKENQVCCEFVSKLVWSQAALELFKSPLPKNS